MKLIAVPLVILAFLGVFGMLFGYETGGSVVINSASGNPEDYYYNEDGYIICCVNGSKYYPTDDGFITYYGTQPVIPVWRNSTGDYVLYTSDQTELVTEHSGEFDMLTGLGFIGAIAAIMIIVSFVGVRVFGSGLSEVSTSTIIKGTVLIAMWCVFSIMAIGLLAQIPLYLGGIFYFMLTVLYAVGIVQNIGGTS